VNEIADKFLIDGGLMNTTVEAQGQKVDVSQPMNIVLWTIQIGVAGMFFMAGGSKLSGSEQMVQLFQAIGLGQWFRYLTGVMEVSGAVLLLLPGLSGLGAALLTGVMAGAVATHVFLIGGNPTLPIVLLVLNACVAWSRRSVLLSLLSRIVKGV